MRRRISSAVGGSNSKEMIESVTLGAYMAAICSASRSVASLMMVGDLLPEASPVMPIAFPRLTCAVRPEYAPQGRPAHPPGCQNFGERHRPTCGGPLHAKFAEFFLHAVPSGEHERLTASPATALSPAPHPT